MAYNLNHHYNRREQNPGSSNQPYVPNSNVHGNAVQNFHATNQQYSSNPPNAHTGRPSEYANNSNPPFDQQHASYRPNISNLNDASQYRSDNRGNTNPSGIYNPSLQNPNFAPHQQNSGDSLHSLKQTLAHTLQNLSNSGAGSGYSQPEHAYRSVQSHSGGPANHSYHAPQNPSQAQYGYEPPTETVYSRSMQPPASLHSTHHLTTNRYSQNAPVDTRISAAVAPVPGDVRYQAAQQAQSAHHSNIAPSYHAGVANRASGLDRNINTFTPTAVPRVAQGFVQPQVGASAYYNRRPDSAGVNTPAYQPDNRGAFSPSDSIMTGGVQMYDQRSQPSADPYVHGASIGGPRRDDIDYSRVAQRDTSPPSNYRNSHSVDRNTTQYNNNPPPSTHSAFYTPQVTSHNRIIVNPLSTLPSRTSKWSAGLVDPLDIYDKLLHNSLCIYEESSSSAQVTNQPNVTHRADNRDDRHISTSTPTTNRYSNNSLSPTHASRKRAISPANSIASDHNYYGSNDNRYTSSGDDRSTRPRVAEYNDPRKNNDHDSRDRSNRFSDRVLDQSRNRRSRSHSRSRSVALRDEKHYNSHPFRSTERFENKTATEQKHGLLNTTATTTTINRLQSMHTKNKPDYALTTPSQLCAMYRTPSVLLHCPQYPTILHVQDLCVKYPRLYVPNDFLRVTLDTQSMLHALDSDSMAKLVEPVPLMVESANPLLRNIPSTTDTGVYESPIFTTLPATSMNSTLVVTSNQESISHNGVLSAHIDTTTTVNRSTAKDMSTKFQVRVLVCCGVEDVNTVDPHKPLEDQLRVLCGERKSGVTLLGCPWDENLDKCDDSGTDSPVTNRSCLVKTVQRALFSQSLLRIPVEVSEDASTGAKHYSSPGLVSLCEINYLRPTEVVNGVESEEQMEVTTIFLYSLQPHLLQPDLFAKNAELFSWRVSGTSACPTINENVEMFGKKAVDRTVASDVNCSDPLVQDNTVFAGVEGDVHDASAHVQGEPSAEVTVSDTDVATTTADVVIADTTAETATAMSTAAADSVDTLLASFVNTNTTNDTTNDLASAPLTCADMSGDIYVSTTAATDYTEKEKRLPPVIPSEPTLLLCPMPYTSDVLQDKKKSRDLVGLKLGTLSDMALGYSQSDRTERVFEMAVAAELTLSLLATNFANTLTDFVLAGHPLLSRDVDTGLVSAFAALRSANLKAKESHTDTSNNRNSSSAAACEKTSDRLTDPSDVSLVVADLLNGIVDSVDFGTTLLPVLASVTEGCEDIDSAEECSFAIDKTPSKEEVVVKLEPMENESSMVVEEVPVENSAVDNIQPVPMECDIEFRSRFLTAARWFDLHGEKCLHLEHLKIILHSSTRVLSVGAVKEAVKRVYENDKFDYETYV